MTLRFRFVSPGRRIYAAHYEHVLGTSLEIQCASTSWWRAVMGRRAAWAALSEIRRLDEIFSTFRPDSELSRWQATSGQYVPVSAELAEVLEASVGWQARTLGGFDPTSESWTRAWVALARAEVRYGSAVESEDDLPTERLTSAPPWEVGRRRDGAAVARKLTPEPISLDAIAKGFIIDRATDVAFRETGEADVLVNIGGDLRHVGGQRVSVGVCDPSADAENAAPIERILIRGEGVATSGGFRRGVSVGGQWRSHIIDPRTGRPVDHISSATVVAPTAMTADVLATAFSVLDPVESLELADSLPGVGCLLFRADGARIANRAWDERVVRAANRRTITRRSAMVSVFAMGLSMRGRNARADGAAGGRASGGRMPRSRPARTAERESQRTTARSQSAGSSQIPWDERYEVAITFSFGDPRGGMASRRPYVVTYIDDVAGNPVRTISLWAQDASWIRNLRRWYRAERARQAEGGESLVSSVTSPTRNPGRYTVIWDGRNDSRELVEQGEYFVCLETIRQGGSNYFTREPFTFESTPFTESMEDYGAFRDIEVAFRERA